MDKKVRTRHAELYDDLKKDNSKKGNPGNGNLSSGNPKKSHKKNGTQKFSDWSADFNASAAPAFAADNTKTVRKKKSLIRKFTTYQVGQNVKLILSLNLVLFLLFFGFFIYQLCHALNDTVSQIVEAPQSGVVSFVGYSDFDATSVEWENGSAGKATIPSILTSALHLPKQTAVSFRFSTTQPFSLISRWAQVSTVFSIPAEVIDLMGGDPEIPIIMGNAKTTTPHNAQTTDRNTENSDSALHQKRFLTVTFRHDTLFFTLLLASVILLGVEVILFVSRIPKTYRANRSMLRPITELTRAAESMNTDADLKLSGTIATINTITEQHLDKRIAIEGERDELKGLASAINGMLDRLDAAYQAQLRFVSDASHELRTPISVIQGYANLLDRWGKKDEKTLQESIDAIKNEAEGMKLLVEQLLFLARSDNHSIAVTMEDFDFAQIADEVFRETKMLDNVHQLNADIHEDLTVYGDPQLIKQALRVFMDNSIKYTPDGGTISLSAANSLKQTGFIEVSVSDSGIGIPEDALPHIFERFYRADESRARKSGGTGLGLAIAKWVIDSHKGFVEIVSRKDVGTKFTIFFPASTRPGNRTAFATTDGQTGSITDGQTGSLNDKQPGSANDS